MPLILVHERRWILWATTVWAVVWILWMWAMSGGADDWMLQMYLLWMPLAGAWHYYRETYLLAGGAFAKVTVSRVPAFVPLATAELKPVRSGWYLRWQDGQVSRSLRPVLTEEAAGMLQRAIQSARSAEPGSVPRTSREAQGTLAIAPAPISVAPFFLMLVGVGGLLVVAVWFNQPLVLLTMVGLGFYLGRLDTPLTVLAGDHLWVTAADGSIVRRVPLDNVREVTSNGWQWYAIRLTDPSEPPVRVHAYQGGDLVRLLKRYLRGERPEFSAAAPGMAENPALEQALRCLLCGRPDQPTAAAAMERPSPADVPAPAGARPVHICDRCADRTRFEAHESGHGPTGKRPKPL